jgi:hypothetical protein
VDHAPNGYVKEKTMSLDNKTTIWIQSTNWTDNYCAKIMKFYAMFLHKTMINALVVQELLKAGDQDLRSEKGPDRGRRINISKTAE